MKNETSSEFVEMSLPCLFEITNDIMQRAIRAGFSTEYLSQCVVRLPKCQDENNLHYDLGFPDYHF